MNKHLNRNPCMEEIVTFLTLSKYTCTRVTVLLCVCWSLSVCVCVCVTQHFTFCVTTHATNLTTLSMHILTDERNYLEIRKLWHETQV